jgi:hypothetical protein
VTAPPSSVEAELAALCNGAAQTAIADACGLSCHTTISDRLGKALMGRKGYLAALTGEQVVRLAASFGPLGNAVRAYIDQEMGGRQSPAALADEVRREISEDAGLIVKCNESLADGKLTTSEKADLVLELQKSVDHRMQLIAHLRASMKEAAHG